MQKTGTIIILIMMLLIVSLVVLQPVKAQTRTIIVPDDYRTLASAIDHANNGDSIYIRAGKYSESALLINKSISLIGENSELTIIDLNSPSHSETVDLIFHYTWYETALNANCDDFKLLGVSITTTGGNIKINGSRIQVTGDSIAADTSIAGSSIQVINNKFSPQEPLNGISVSGNFCNVSANQVVGALYVNGKNNIISSNDVKGDTSISVNDSLIQNNNLHDSGQMFTINGNNNVFFKNVIDHYGFGPSITGSGNSFLLNNITRCGFAVSPGTGNSFYANYFYRNAWILDNTFPNSQSSNESVFFDNNFVNNYNYKVAVAPSAINCLLDNGKQGNYWSDYQGTDVNNDGIGDSPYTLDSSHVDHYPLMSPFNFSTVSELVPNWLITSEIKLISPQNTEYTDQNLPISFFTDGQTKGYYYSIDGKKPVSVTGNTSISGLSVGQHNITVYALDNFDNFIPSQTMMFIIQTAFLGKPVSTGNYMMIIFAVGIIIIIIGAAVALIFTKHRKKLSQDALRVNNYQRIFYPR
jgi:nitrous oxidase accessory protein NosD